MRDSKCKPFFSFFSCVRAKTGIMVPSVAKSGSVTKVMHRKSVHDFYLLKALITSEQVITSVVEKKKNLNK